MKHEYEEKGILQQVKSASRNSVRMIGEAQADQLNIFLTPQTPLIFEGQEPGPDRIKHCYIKLEGKFNILQELAKEL